MASPILSTVLLGLLRPVGACSFHLVGQLAEIHSIGTSNSIQFNWFNLACEISEALTVFQATPPKQQGAEANGDGGALILN